MRIIEDIQLAEMASAYVKAPFDKGRKALKLKEYEIISLEQDAKLKIEKGKQNKFYSDLTVLKNGNFVREMVLILPGGKFYLTKRLSTNFYGKGKPPYISSCEWSQIAIALEDSVAITDKEVPTNRFGENDLTVYAFGEQAEPYGLYSRSEGIEKLCIRISGSEDRPFAMQLWFGFGTWISSYGPGGGPDIAFEYLNGIPPHYINKGRGIVRGFKKMP